MSKRLDVLRSFVRQSTETGFQRLRNTAVIESAQKLWSELHHQRVVIREAMLSAAVARVSGLTGAMVSARDGVLRVSLELVDGQSVAATLIPLPPHFAAGGAKELRFKVEPVELARDIMIREVVAALAGLIAFRLWHRFGDEIPENLIGGFVEYTKDGEVYMDIRSVPTMQRLPPAAARILLEAFYIAAIHAQAGTLTVELNVSTRR